MRYYGAIPVEATAIARGKFPHANLHVNIPSDACRDLVYEYARRVRDNFPAGRKVIVERSNERWNWAFTSFRYVSVLGSVAMPGWPAAHKGQPNLLAYCVYLAADDRSIFREVCAETGRQDEVMTLLNAHMGTDPAYYLDVARAIGTTIDAFAVAPYLLTEATAYNAQVADSYDDEQLIDMFVHDLYYSPTTYNSWAKTAREAIARYNAATGGKYVLMAYEGGFETIVPSPQPLTRRYRDERTHDLAYNPNWWIAEQDYYAWEQQSGSRVRILTVSHNTGIRRDGGSITGSCTTTAKATALMAKPTIDSAGPIPEPPDTRGLEPTRIKIVSRFAEKCSGTGWPRFRDEAGNLGRGIKILASESSQIVVLFHQ